MSNANVFYLKYRPQTLSELIGQEVVKNNLLFSFQNNKLSHAYLFVGPRGTGKTSTARILAKMVNCEKSSDNTKSLKAESEATPKTGEAVLKTDSDTVPCNKCSICLSITDGSNMDLIEIDAASNRGIEDIRALRDKIKLAPTNSKKKVYIIDEVHMLTAEAFNALLKTLEEPPAHALFILATTEGGKIPQTILSRVQRLDFKLATFEQLLEALTKIVKAEKIDIDDEALQLLIKKSDGSFRDGVKLLDQIASIGGKITAGVITENLKSAQSDNVLNLIRSFIEKHAQDGLLNINRQLDSGVDVKELMLSTMDTLRNLVLIKNRVGEQLVKINLTEDQYQSLVKLAASSTMEDLVWDLDILQNSLEKMKFASIPSLPLELAVVEICEGSSKFKVQSSKLAEQTEVTGEKLEDQTSNLQPQDPSSNFQHLASNNDIRKIKEKWTFVLETIRPINFSLEALLRACSITECNEKTLIMEVPYAFHQRILEAPKNRSLLEGIFSDVLGRAIRISTVLGIRSAKKEDVVNIEVAQDDEIIRAAAEIFSADSVN